MTGEIVEGEIQARETREMSETQRELTGELVILKVEVAEEGEREKKIFDKDIEKREKAGALQ